MNNFRKIIYTIFFLIYLFIYILISMRIGVFVLELNNIIIEILFYMLVGVLWTVPVIFILKKND
ncbi:MAG: hypothetical protein CML86_01625 [Rhodobiaceae bacterium]|nr:hypothetical protein [Rhodobiaceae bacterium]RZO31757.1 MAG: DUF2842 domain-containing protein [Hyphomicrobiales bacterium]